MVRKPWAITLLVIAAAVAAAVVIAVHVPDPGIAPALAQRQPDATHGQYIATLGDCAACHTKPGGKTLAGGLPLTTPLGTIYTTNITPDRDTGIGSYTFTDFARAMRLGVRPDGARLYPAMPYTAYAKLSDEDLQDLFAHLQKDIAAVSQTPPANTVGWPLNMRWPMAFWNVAFLDSAHFTPDPSKDAQWNRGAYVVEALEHCGECHTPRQFTEILRRGAAGLEGLQPHSEQAIGPRRLERRRGGVLSEHRPRRRPQLGKRADGRSGRQQFALCDARRHPRHRRLPAWHRADRQCARHRAKPARCKRSIAASEPRRPGLRRQLRQLPRLGRQGCAIA